MKSDKWWISQTFTRHRLSVFNPLNAANSIKIIGDPRVKWPCFPWLWYSKDCIVSPFAQWIDCMKDWSIWNRSYHLVKWSRFTCGLIVIGHLKAEMIRTSATISLIKNQPQNPGIDHGSTMITLSRWVPMLRNMSSHRLWSRSGKNPFSTHNHWFLTGNWVKIWAYIMHLPAPVLKAAGKLIATMSHCIINGDWGKQWPHQIKWLP